MEFKSSILFIKSDDPSPEILQSLSSLGCQSFRLNLLNFEYSPYELKIINFFEKINNFSALALNSVNSGIALKMIKEKMGIFLEIVKNMDVFVVGEKTAKFLQKEFGWKVSLIGKNFEDLVQKMNEFYKNKQNFKNRKNEDNEENKDILTEKILYLIGNLSDLKQAKITENYEFHEIIAYATKEISYPQFELQINEILKKNIDFPKILIYFSASNVRFFMNYIQEYEKNNGLSTSLNERKHICFGEKTKEEFDKFNKNSLIPKENIFIAKMSNIIEIPDIIEKIIKGN